MKLLIDTKTGTIIDPSECVFIELKNLNDVDNLSIVVHQRAQSELKIGKPIQRIADAHGKSVEDALEGSGWGDLSTSNCMAFSVQAMREEIGEKLAQDYANRTSEDDADSDLIEASTLDDDQLADLGQYIMASDDLWRAFREEFRIGLTDFLDMRRRESQEKVGA